MKIFRPLFLCMLVAMTVPSVMAADSEEKHSYKPLSGYVPNEETAIKIAVAVWEPIYGREKISQEKPYRAVLKDGVWVIKGTLPKGRLGGTAIAEIYKDDGKVLRISHGQ